MDRAFSHDPSLQRKQELLGNSVIHNIFPLRAPLQEPARWAAAGSCERLSSNWAQPWVCPAPCPTWHSWLAWGAADLPQSFMNYVDWAIFSISLADSSSGALSASSWLDKADLVSPIWQLNSACNLHAATASTQAGTSWSLGSAGTR